MSYKNYNLNYNSPAVFYTINTYKSNNNDIIIIIHVSSSSNSNSRSSTITRGLPNNEKNKEKMIKHDENHDIHDAADDDNYGDVVLCLQLAINCANIHTSTLYTKCSVPLM